MFFALTEISGWVLNCTSHPQRFAFAVTQLNHSCHSKSTHITASVLWYISYHAVVENTQINSLQIHWLINLNNNPYCLSCFSDYSQIMTIQQLASRSSRLHAVMTAQGEKWSHDRVVTVIIIFCNKWLFSVHYSTVTHHFRGCVSGLYLLYFTFHSRTSLQCWQSPSWVFDCAFYDKIHKLSRAIIEVFLFIYFFTSCKFLNNVQTWPQKYKTETHSTRQHTVNSIIT